MLGRAPLEYTAGVLPRWTWVRALVIGSGIPGSGKRLRHNAASLRQMGLAPPTQSATPQPGGMPIHAMLEHVLLPERDLVPTRVRWRDDKLIFFSAIAAILTWIGFGIWMVVRALTL